LNLIEKYGVDSLRFTLAALATQGRDIKLSEDRITGYRNFITKINNVSKYLKINNCYINKDFNLDKTKLPVNHWIIDLLDNFSIKIYNDIKSYRFNEAANKIYHFVWHYYCDWYIELTKSNIDDNSEIRNINAYVFSKILILLHPISPFNTEFLYSNVHKFGPVLALESWPEECKKLIIKKDNINEINWIINFISEIRSLRSILNIKHKSLIKINYLDLNKNYISYLNNNMSSIKQMARVENIVKINAKIDEVAQIIVDKATFFIPVKGLIDIKAEYNRLNNDLSKFKTDINLIDNKLNNKNFIKNAPKDVIDEQKNKKKKLKSSSDRITLALKNINI